MKGNFSIGPYEDNRRNALNHEESCTSTASSAPHPISRNSTALFIPEQHTTSPPISHSRTGRAPPTNRFLVTYSSTSSGEGVCCSFCSLFRVPNRDSPK